MVGYLYILRDERQKFYIGSTSDITRRMDQHHHGHTYTTKKMKNPELVFSQKFDTLQEARNAELKLKEFKRRDFIEKIIRDGHVKIKLG